MDIKSIKGKRKKKKDTCPNPLFVKWLTEWRDEAAEKGLKSQYCYRKALASLKKYPLVFTSGKECKVLENFGDKICKMLDVKLAKYIAEHGTTLPLDKTDEVESPPRKCLKQVRAASSTTYHGDVCFSVGSHTYSHVDSLSDDDVESSPPQHKTKRRSHSSGEREYVPGYRSGPYAILLTLFRNHQRANGRGFMIKADLMREAQHLADKSFTVPDPGCRYTAWSSMSTLIRKGFVIKESSPAKYSITERGCELAHKLEGVREMTFSPSQSPGSRLSTHSGLYPTPSTNASWSVTDFVGNRDPELPSLPEDEIDSVRPSFSSDNRLQYWYITESGERTIDKNRATVIVDDSLGIGFLITCNYQALLKSGKLYKLDMSRPLTDDKIFAYLQDSAATDFADPPSECSNSSLTEKKSSSKRDNCVMAPKNTKAIEKKKPQSKSKPIAVAVDPSLTVIESKPIAVAVDPSLTGIESKPIAVAVDPSLTVIETHGSSLSERLCASSTTSLSTAHNTVTSIESKPLTDITPVFTLQPGTFEIVLCVDNQEFYGKTSSGGKTLLAELIKNGINCDLRKLQVGDFLWVAREKVASVHAGQLARPEAREVVLDHIIERKRMDDLVSSCIDGRFKEQKFRLKRCGLRCPIYLIEDYGSVQNFSMPEDRLRQTIANTQVVDGFQVKRTADNKESVAYLTIMTRYLQSHYQNKRLHAYPAEILADIAQPYNINSTEHKLLEFKQFNEASVKTKNLSISEMFGKQIIQMYRLSAEGAKAILDQYPTPASLIAAYDRSSTEKEKEELLSKVKSGKAGRSLGVAVSRQFYQLYCTNKPLT